MRAVALQFGKRALIVGPPGAYLNTLVFILLGTHILLERLSAARCACFGWMSSVPLWRRRSGADVERLERRCDLRRVDVPAQPLPEGTLFWAGVSHRGLKSTNPFHAEVCTCHW